MTTTNQKDSSATSGECPYFGYSCGNKQCPQCPQHATTTAPQAAATASAELTAEQARTELQAMPLDTIVEMVRGATTTSASGRCARCNGRGLIDNSSPVRSTCPRCNGTGRAPAPSREAAVPLDVRQGFERYMSNRGEAVNYEGDWLYAAKAVNDQADAFRAGVEFANTTPARYSAEPAPSAPAASELNHADTVLKVQEALGFTTTGYVSPDVILLRIGQAQKAAQPAEVSDGELPPLPEPALSGGAPLRDYFTAEQYRQGQREAIAAYSMALDNITGDEPEWWYRLQAAAEQLDDSGAKANAIDVRSIADKLLREFRAGSTAGDAWISVSERMPVCDLNRDETPLTVNGVTIPAIQYSKPVLVAYDNPPLYDVVRAAQTDGRAPIFEVYGSRVTCWMQFAAAPSTPAERGASK